MLRSFLLASVTAMISAAAFAADLPARMPAKAPAMYSPAPVVSWGGFYGGLNGGYGWSSSHWDQPTTGLGSDQHPTGGFFGAQFGYNLQFQQFVLGIETDADWSSIKGSSTGTGCGTACETKNTWFGTTRARVGMPLGANGAWLPYVTGGLAYGEVKVTDIGITRGSTQYGWTIGAGVETMFAPAWSAKLEYLYVDLRKFTTIGDGTSDPFDVTYRSNILRGGVNYHF